MNGFAGWVDFQLDMRSRVSEVREMAKKLTAHGSMEHDLWHSAHAALGSRGAIAERNGLDPAAVRTIEGANSSVALCLSGTIYNHEELRAKLIGLGYQFRTTGQAELLLTAYLRWNVDMVDRLDGAFAFCIWDERSKTVMLARDRLGVKPIFYLCAGEGILFATELKAIFANRTAPRQVSLEGLRELLNMVKTPQLTPYVGVHEVVPGQIVKFDRHGASRKVYWTLEAKPHLESFDATAHKVRELLEGSVRRQSVAEEPVGSLLSGGLDSSTVTALAAKQMGPTVIRSFALDFEKNRQHFVSDAVRTSSDAPYARALAEHVGSEHLEVVLGSDELLDPAVRASVLAATDMPPAYWGDMWASLFLLFKEARRHNAVVLSGEGADEVFGGYQWFRNPAAIQGDSFPWLTSGAARYFGGTQLLSSEMLNRLDLEGHRRDAYREALERVPVLAGESGNERRLREMAHLGLTRFLRTLLDRMDRMGTATGLEVRTPFCDHELVEYVFNVPWQMKLVGNREKGLLRASVKDLLPDQILNRVKSPYPATQDPIYEAGLRTALREVLDDPTSPVLPLISRQKAEDLLGRNGSAASHSYNRGGLEMTLWMNRWLRDYQIDLQI